MKFAADLFIIFLLVIALSVAITLAIPRHKRVRATKWEMATSQEKPTYGLSYSTHVWVQRYNGGNKERIRIGAVEHHDAKYDEKYLALTDKAVMRADLLNREGDSGKDATVNLDK